MLVLNEVEELSRVGLSDKLERTYLKGCRESADNVDSLVVSECLLEEFLSVVDTAFGDVLLCETELVELVYDRVFRGLVDTFGVGDLKCQRFDLLFLEVCEQLRRTLGSECDHEN